MTTTACPRCAGRGRIDVMPVSVKPVLRNVQLHAGQLSALMDTVSACRFCKTTGQVTSEQLEWGRVGAQWKAWRREACIGMRHWADMVGCLPSDYCEMELGYREPDPQYAPTAARVTKVRLAAKYVS